MVIETNASKKKQIPLDFGTALLNNVIVTKPHNNRRGIMKNRKRGFSLVELLIVLAVIAALIATITPVALNAIRKSQATKVAQNIKTLAAAIENAAYVNGVDASYNILRDTTTALSEQGDIVYLGRDISADDYAVWYKYNSSTNLFDVAIVTDEVVDFTTAKDVVSGLTNSPPNSSSYSVTLGNVTTPTIGYTFTFAVF